ncbi:MAG: tetratricopeptide repeat protein [Candidatus Melainabacteria bacterium]|nr:tetratricopeptide repeat protein [Candidatus Melainabacteria bacterium]
MRKQRMAIQPVEKLSVIPQSLMPSLVIPHSVSHVSVLLGLLTLVTFAAPAFSFDKTKWMDVKREGQRLEVSGHYATAEKYFRQAMQISSTFPKNSSERIETLYHVCNILVLQGKYWDAEIFFQKLVLMVQEQKKDGTLDHEALVWMEDLADSYSHAVHGWLEHLALEHSVQLRDIISGDENRYMATTLRKLVTILFHEGKYYKADPYAMRLVRITSKFTGKNELVKASDLFLLSLVQFQIGKYAMAESNLRQALNLYTKMEIPPGFCTGNTLTQLARVLQAQNQFELAEQSAKRALKIFERSKGKNNIVSIQTHEVLVDLYKKSGKYAQAASEHEQLISIMMATNTATDAQMLKWCKDQKALYLKSKNTAKAREMDRKIGAISKRIGAKNPTHGH